METQPLKRAEMLAIYSGTAPIEAQEEADKELDQELQSENLDPENVYDPDKGSTHS